MFKTALPKYVLIVITLLYSGNVYAADYSVLPLIFDENFEARDIVTRDITLTNAADHIITVYPTVNNISVKDGGKIQEFLAPVESDRTASLASWIEINRLGIDLKPHEERTVTVTFRVNPSPVPGTYHAFIGFGTGGNRDDAEKMVASGSAPGVLVNVTIEDKKNEFLKLSKFFIDKFVTKPDNNAVEFSFVNPGDEVLVPEGEIILYDGRGREVSAIKVNEERVSVAPGEEHTFTASVPIEGMFGKYKAFLSIEYGTIKRASLQDTYFFYVFPLKKLLVILSILLSVVCTVAWYFHKKYLDVANDDESDRLIMHIRDTQSDAQDHDINLKK